MSSLSQGDIPLLSDAYMQGFVPGPRENFTGQGAVQTWFQSESPSRFFGGFVYFDPGAHTYWHRHPQGQLLIVLQGACLLQIAGEAPCVVPAGESVWIGADLVHWHGALPDRSMVHVALQDNAGDGGCHWMHEVSAEDYGQTLAQLKP